MTSNLTFSCLLGIQIQNEVKQVFIFWYTVEIRKAFFPKIMRKEQYNKKKAVVPISNLKETVSNKLINKSVITPTLNEKKI